MKFTAVAAISAIAFSQIAYAQTNCLDQQVFDLCLTNQDEYLKTCASTDYACLCQWHTAKLTCYNSCPNDLGRHTQDGLRITYCSISDTAASVSSAAAAAATVTQAPAAVASDAAAAASDAAVVATSEAAAAASDAVEDVKSVASDAKSSTPATGSTSAASSNFKMNSALLGAAGVVGYFLI